MRLLPDPDLSFRDTVDFIFYCALCQRALGDPHPKDLTLLIRDVAALIHRLTASCHLPEFAAPPPLGVAGAAVQLALELSMDHPDRRAEVFSACQALVLAAYLRAEADVSASEELMDAFRAPTWFASPKRSEVVARTVVHELAEKMESLVSASARSTSPRVRGQVAVFLAALKARDALTAKLQSVHESLLKDPRASVRRFAAAS